MLRNLVLFLLIGLWGLYFPSTVLAEKIAGESASIWKVVKEETNKVSSNFLIKEMVLKKILTEYHSPLSNNSQDFINACWLYRLDCYLLPSIAGVESYFGRRLLPYSYNPFGWKKGNYRFNSYSNAIYHVGRKIRVRYIDQGATTLERIGVKYAANPAWSLKVRYFMNKFEREEAEISLYFKTNPVQL